MFNLSTFTPFSPSRPRLALSVSMSAGPKVQFGTEAKPLHAGLAGFIHRKQEAAFTAGLRSVRGLVYRVHIPVPGIGAARGECGRAVCYRTLYK